jgi:hypothetical protein
MADTIRAERAVVNICDGISLEAYRMLDGELRLGIGSASLAIGLSSNWLTRLIRRQDVAFQILQRTGFTGEVKIVMGRNKPVGTISCSDFVKAALFAQKQRRNFNSQKVLEALVTRSIGDLLADTFSAD